MTSIIDLENSNLPIDYFTSVLPRAQYGDEAVVPVGLNDADAVIRTSDPLDKTKAFFLIMVHLIRMIIFKDQIHRLLLLTVKLMLPLLFLMLQRANLSVFLVTFLFLHRV